MSETQIKGIWLHRRAETALDAFTPEERRKVERALEFLGDPTARDLVAANSWPLPIPESTRIFRATPDVRILFEDAPEAARVDRMPYGPEFGAGVRVLDIVRADVLKAFATPTPHAPVGADASPRRPATAPKGPRKRVGGLR